MRDRTSFFKRDAVNAKKIVTHRFDDKRGIVLQP
jgi:hypothetical protein